MDQAELAARAAGLRYVTDRQPGIRRRRSGTGWSYKRDDGAPVTKEERARIASLAIPPAWTDVWICADPRGHVQATGRDAKGRKQARYHAGWRSFRDETKYERLGDFGAALPELRRAVDRDLSLAGFPREKALALVVALLDKTLVRVGNDEYAASNASYGLTTLLADHARVEGPHLELDFTGKSGVPHRLRLTDQRLAKLVQRCSDLGGQELFSYVEDGVVRDVGSADVNDYLRDRMQADVTAKHFRTWGGTCSAAGALALCPPADTKKGLEAQLLAAYDVASTVLGNTRAVCRSSYVHPRIAEAHGSGELQEAWKRARHGERASRIERAVATVLPASAAAPATSAGADRPAA